MTHQEAIRILMLSPVYFKLAPIDRFKLIKDYCDTYSKITSKQRNSEKEN